MDTLNEKDVSVRNAFRRSLVQSGGVGVLLLINILLLHLYPTAFDDNGEVMAVTIGFLTLLFLFVGLHTIGTIVLYLDYRRRRKATPQAPEDLAASSASD